jgi:diguanylate cyclase (GGDEF)-like protein
MILFTYIALLTFAWSDQSAPKSLKVVLDNNYPPYVFHDSTGKLQGILVDEWALFQKKTGIVVTLHAMNWSDALDGMGKGDYDVIDTIFINPDREKLYHFTKPYADLDVSIFFHKNISGINTVESLKGFTVAAKRGDNAVSILEKAGIENLKLYDSYEAIIQASEKNEVVVFVIDNPPALYFLYKYSLQDQFKHTTPLYTGQFHRAVQKDHPELIKVIESGFSKINQGEHQEISEKWFGKSDFVTKIFKGYVVSFMIVIVTIVLLLLVWNTTLRQSVNKKTKDLRTAIDNLSYSESKLKAVMDSMPDWVFVLNHEGTIVDFLSNSKSDGLLAAPPDFIHHNLSEFFSPEITHKFISSLDEVLETGKTAPVEYGLELEAYHHYEVRYEKLSAGQAIAIVRDTTERFTIEQKIRDLSILDAPTASFNRNYFESQMELYRKNGLQGLSFLMIDFDGLKLVNDTLGHSTGDRYLRTVADLLRETFPTAEFVARIGGDEFVVVLKDWTEPQIQQEKINIKAAIDQINVDEHRIPFSLSMGYSSFSPTNSTVEDMLKAADDYMYREKLFHRQSMRSRNIDTLSTMLEERDFITQGHGDRMSALVVALAKAIQFADTEMESMALFAQFHDIGKIGISDAILFKPYKLTEKEFTEIKRHTEIGYRIAESSLDLMHISEWIYKHHEWWNGTGYPFGLKGEDIPLPCRILTIVDAYDAMTNDRPYRQALTIEDTILELKAKAGIQFDPNLVELFIALIQ